MITGEINIISQPGEQCWPGLAWIRSDILPGLDQARPNFQNSAWIGSLAWQVTRRLAGARPGWQLWLRKPSKIFKKAGLSYSKFGRAFVLKN
jgi:hypothetical protein